VIFGGTRGCAYEGLRKIAPEDINPINSRKINYRIRGHFKLYNHHAMIWVMAPVRMQCYLYMYTLQPNEAMERKCQSVT
jgi:hypothetical protein